MLHISFLSLVWRKAELLPHFFGILLLAFYFVAILLFINMARFIICSIIILLSLVKQALTESLATSFDGPNGDNFADGDKFSIITGSTAVSIERFDIHMAAVTKTVEIWTKDGYPNWWNDNTWTKIWEGTIVGQGQGVATPLPALSSPIEVAANSVLGVYTLLDDYAGNNMYHSTGVLGQNQVFVSDSYISIGEGISSWHMHANFQQPTRWNGKSSHFISILALNIFTLTMMYHPSFLIQESYTIHLN